MLAHLGVEDKEPAINFKAKVIGPKDLISRKNDQREPIHLRNEFRDIHINHRKQIMEVLQLFSSAFISKGTAYPIICVGPLMSSS